MFAQTFLKTGREFRRVAANGRRVYGRYTSRVLACYSPGSHEDQVRQRVSLAKEQKLNYRLPPREGNTSDRHRCSRSRRARQTSGVAELTFKGRLKKTV